MHYYIRRTNPRITLLANVPTYLSITIIKYNAWEKLQSPALFQRVRKRQALYMLHV